MAVGGKFSHPCLPTVNNEVGGLGRKNRSNSVSNPKIDSITFNKSGGEESYTPIIEANFVHKCPLCASSYQQAKSLKNHQRKYHEERDSYITGQKAEMLNSKETVLEEIARLVDQGMTTE